MTIQIFKGVQNQELVLKADYDKLAAECAALNEDRLAWAKRYADEMGDAQIYEYSLLFETPATDAAIAEFKAQGVDEFAADIGQSYNQLRQGSGQQKALKSFIFRAIGFSAKLRAGVKG